MEEVDKIVIFSLQNVTLFFFFQLLRFSFHLPFLNFYNFTAHSLLLREPVQSGNSHSYGPSIFFLFSLFVSLSALPGYSV